MATGEMTAAKELNLQARFEQLEGSINEAHQVLDQMSPREAAVDKSAQADSGTATAIRCQQSLGELINRLQGLRDQVGQV